MDLHPNKRDFNWLQAYLVQGAFTNMALAVSPNRLLFLLKLVSHLSYRTSCNPCTTASGAF